MRVAGSEFGESIEHGQVVGWQGGVLRQDHPPAIPGKQLHLVERSHIPEEIPLHKIDAVHIEDAKLIGVCLSAATHLPGCAAGDELVARHIQRVEGYVQDVLLQLIELWIDQRSTMLSTMTLTFAGGDTKTMAFTNVEVNAPITLADLGLPSA